MLTPGLPVSADASRRLPAQLAGSTTLTVRTLPDCPVTVAVTPWPATRTLFCGLVLL